MDIKKVFDAIVIGSGPGGATVAKELSERKKSVLLLEMGTDEPIQGSKYQVVKDLGIPGRSSLVTYGGLACVRAIAVGGTSVYYYATVFDPPHVMFKKYGIDVKEETAEAFGEIPTDQLKDELLGPMSKRVMESARSLGLDWQKMHKFIYQDKCRSNCDLCQMGCPHGAKWTARVFVDQAVKNGAQLLDKAKAEAIIMDGKRAVGVEFTRKGKKHRAYAENIILAAGGIGSPVLLRKLGIKRAGIDFFYDPLICVMGSCKDVKGGKEIPMSTGMHFPDEGIVMTDMTVPNALYMGLAAEVFRFDRLFSHAHTLGIMIKANDSLGGRLTDTGGVRKKLAAEDRAKLLNGYEKAKKILKHAGAKNIFKSWYIAAHPGGTVRINDLLDSNLKTEYDNLYACDCSVLPEPWGLPPTMSIICLGKRLAKHLAVVKKVEKSQRTSMAV